VAHTIGHVDPERDKARTGRAPDADGPADDGLTQEERAQAAILRITRDGADPAAEALALANRFTDEQTGRLGRWWRRRRDRG
jgi:hypothetical protein